MNNIYVNVIGNGTGWVDNPNPNNGDIITIYAYLTPPASLIDITMQSEYGYYIAVSVTPVQQIQYDSSWGDCTITITFSHDIITVNANGSGIAYVDNPNPNNGDTVTLTANPVGRKYMLIGIECYDDNFNLIWTATTETTQFIYDSSWGDITIECYFDLKWLYKNLWILFQKQWWRKNNY